MEEAADGLNIMLETEVGIGWFWYEVIDAEKLSPSHYTENVDCFAQNSSVNLYISSKA
jgi:hypothetical protein